MVSSSKNFSAKVNVIWYYFKYTSVGILQWKLIATRILQEYPCNIRKKNDVFWGKTLEAKINPENLLVYLKQYSKR